MEHRRVSTSEKQRSKFMCGFAVFLGNKIPEKQRKSVTHQVCVGIPSELVTPMRKAYYHKLKAEFPAEFIAYTTQLRLKGEYYELI